MSLRRVRFALHAGGKNQRDDLTTSGHRSAQLKQDMIFIFTRCAPKIKLMYGLQARVRRWQHPAITFANRGDMSPCVGFEDSKCLAIVPGRAETSEVVAKRQRPGHEWFQIF